MDLTLLAILYTALSVVALQSLRHAGRPGPGGRRRAIPRYQRRVLACVAVVCLCSVVDAWLLARRGGAPRPALGGLLATDGGALLGVLAACALLRGDARRRAVTLTGLALGLFALSVMAAWSALAFAWIRDDGARFLDHVRAAWGTSGAAAGLIALFHYLLAPALLAAAFTAHERWPELREWEKDAAFRPLAALSSVLALGYLAFTWGALSA